MKRKFDFVLEDWKGYHRDIFRYYPRRTHVHSHNENPPKTWEEVYKVYYSWAIIRQYYDDNIENKIENSEILFLLDCDECSQLPNLSGIIKYVMETGKVFNYPTFGQPAGDWCIKKKKESEDCEYYFFQVFNNWTNQGYRFTLNKNKTLEYCEWLDKINQYALKHGEEL